MREKKKGCLDYKINTSKRHKNIVLCGELLIQDCDDAYAHITGGV
jgi:hypothetical protein